MNYSLVVPVEEQGPDRSRSCRVESSLGPSFWLHLFYCAGSARGGGGGVPVGNLLISLST